MRSPFALPLPAPMPFDPTHSPGSSKFARQHSFRRLQQEVASNCLSHWQGEAERGPPALAWKINRHLFNPPRICPAYILKRVSCRSIQCSGFRHAIKCKVRVQLTICAEQLLLRSRRTCRQKSLYRALKARAQALAWGCSDRFSCLRRCKTKPVYQFCMTMEALALYCWPSSLQRWGTGLGSACPSPREWQVQALSGECFLKTGVCLRSC